MGDIRYPASEIGGLTKKLRDDGDGVYTPVVSVPGSRLISALGSTIIRPVNTTAYAQNDNIADSATAASVSAFFATVADVADAPVAITAIELETNDTGLAAGIQVRVNVFSKDNTAAAGVAGGDNAAYSQKKDGWRGSFTGTFKAFADGGKCLCLPEPDATSGVSAPFLVSEPEVGGRRLWFTVQVLTAAGFTPSANSTTIASRFRGFQGRV